LLHFAIVLPSGEVTIQATVVVLMVDPAMSTGAPTSTSGELLGRALQDMGAAGNNMCISTILADLVSLSDDKEDRLAPVQWLLSCYSCPSPRLGHYSLRKLMPSSADERIKRLSYVVRSLCKLYGTVHKFSPGMLPLASTLGTVNNLGNLYSDQGKIVEAEMASTAGIREGVGN
jgi:hypothetical protein